MGYGSYKASDWAKLKSSRNIGTHSDANEIFKGNEFQDKYNPRFIQVRESCDSPDSPFSTPIIFAFDVTGSMGFLAAEIAKNSLNKTILELYDKQPVTNPHVMCAAITQPVAEGGLQVTQFEADIRVVEQLLELKVGFGGNLYSYDSLIWYFAAKHTSIDSFKKRGKKGFLFCIGDEKCGFTYQEKLDKHEIMQVFGDTADRDYSLRELAAMAMEQYEIFHIVIDNRYGTKVFDSWNNFLPGRVAVVKDRDVKYLSEVITSVMQLANGVDRASVLAQWDKEVRLIVETAIEHILPDNEKTKKTGGLFSKLFS